MLNPFRKRLSNFETLLGTIISTPAVEIAEIFANAGYDWLFIDLEHSPLGISEAQKIIQAVSNRIHCIIRVPSNDEIWAKKALDTGADGIIFPQINTKEDAERAVRFCKYPPIGTRSVGISRSQGYGKQFQTYIDNANNNSTVIIQIEHIKAIENIEEIVTVEGIDAILVGPYDLSASMNCIGQIDNPIVQTAISRVKEACIKTKTPLGIFTIDLEIAKKHLLECVTLIVLSGDLIMVNQVSNLTVQAFKNNPTIQTDCDLKHNNI